MHGYVERKSERIRERQRQRHRERKIERALPLSQSISANQDDGSLPRGVHDLLRALPPSPPSLPHSPHCEPLSRMFLATTRCCFYQLSHDLIPWPRKPNPRRARTEAS